MAKNKVRYLHFMYLKLLVKLGASRIWISKNNINNQVIQFVTFWSPSSTSLNFFQRGHFTIPKRAPAELPGICGIYETAKVEWWGYFSTFCSWPIRVQSCELTQWAGTQLHQQLLKDLGKTWVPWSKGLTPPNFKGLRLRVEGTTKDLPRGFVSTSGSSFVEFSRT